MRIDAQRRLVEMIRAGMEEQDIKQNEMARRIGTSSGMISSAFGCKLPMREERWRMCCEAVGIGYDEAMQQIEEEVRNESEKDTASDPAQEEAPCFDKNHGIRVICMEGYWGFYKKNGEDAIYIKLKDNVNVYGKTDVESICREIRAACRMMLGDAYDDA